MKNLFITLALILFLSPEAFAQPECEFSADNKFVCEFEGESGLEIFEDITPSQVEEQAVVNVDSYITYAYQPVLKGHDLNIDMCWSEVKFEASAKIKTTCILKKDGLSIVPVKNKTTILPVRNKTTIIRADAR